jgi:uncharacterized protein (TIGR03089 family)
MDESLAQTVVDILSLSVSGSARPVLTYYDDATGERTELSGVTLANWVAKTANLLVDGLGLGDGAVAAVRLPAHWQTGAVLLGCWSAGLVVDRSGAPGTSADVAFVGVDTVDTVVADETYALALAPLGQGFRSDPPSGTADYVREVRVHGDVFRSGRPVAASSPALTDGTTHGQLLAAGRARALTAGSGRDQALTAGSRVLIDGDRVTDPLDWLVAPMVAGGSVVLCRNVDPDRLPARLAAERAVLGRVPSHTESVGKGPFLTP